MSRKALILLFIIVTITACVPAIGITNFFVCADLYIYSLGSRLTTRACMSCRTLLMKHTKSMC
jgi:hypothetical protein